jgi:diguanylate cyclase (GGDEF)-like protein
MRNLFEARAGTFVLAVGAASAAVVGVLDYLTGPLFPLLPVYLLPVYYAATYGGRTPGVVVAVLGGFFHGLAIAFAAPAPAPLVQVVWNALMAGTVGVLFTVLLVKLGQARSRTRALSLTDFQTGALNSRAFYNLAENEYRKGQRYQRPLSVAYITVDNFKAVNRQHGHTEGDRLLLQVARTLMRYLRATDRVARLGGDEFVVMLPETDREAAQVAVGKISERLVAQMREYQWPVTFSVGVVTFKSMPKVPRGLIGAAEKVMWAVKKEGKNGIRYATYYKRTAAS